MQRRSGSAPKVLGAKRSGSTTANKSTRPKPAWDSTNHDLTVHRLTDAEIRRRKETLVSKHIDEARVDVNRFGSERSETDFSTPRDISPSQLTDGYNPNRRTRQEVYDAISAPMMSNGEFDIGTFQRQVQLEMQRAYDGVDTETNDDEHVVDFEQEIAGFDQFKSECSSEEQSKGSSKSQQSKQYKVAIPVQDFRKPQHPRPASPSIGSNTKKAVKPGQERNNLDEFEGKMSHLETRMKSLEMLSKQPRASPEVTQHASVDPERISQLEAVIAELDGKLKQESAQRTTLNNSLVLCNRRIDDLSKELSVSRQETETLREELARVVLHYEQQLGFIKQDIVTTQQRTSAYNLDLIIDKLNSAHDVASYLETPQSGYSDEMIFYEARERKEPNFEQQGAQRNPNSVAKGRENDGQVQHNQPTRGTSPGRVVFRNPQAGIVRAGQNTPQGLNKPS